MEFDYYHKIWGAFRRYWVPRSSLENFTRLFRAQNNFFDL